MKAVVAGLIVVALLAAGGTAFFVKRFLSSQKQAPVTVVEKPVAKTFVLVANSNLPVGHKIGSGSLRWQEWSETGIHKSFVTSGSKDEKLKAPLIDSVVRRGIAEGTPVTAAVVAKRGEAGFLAVAIDASKVAVAVAVTAVTGTGGFIQPGDRVDVILTHDVSKGLPKSSSDEAPQTDTLAKWASETVVTNVRVLAIDQKFNEFEDKITVAKTVTLEATPKEAQTLALAASMGGLTLALRSLVSEGEGDSAKAADAGAVPFTTDVEISPALAQAMRKSAAQSGEKSKAKDTGLKTETTRVKIYKGGQGTTQEFSGR